MESWPSTDYTRRKAKGKSKAATSDQVSHYPVVEHGALTSANLHRKGNRLQWSFLCEEEAHRKLVLVRDPVKVFPATRPKPHTSKLGVNQTSEQATQFLRLHYPDADFSYEIIKDAIAEDFHEHQTLSHYDPYTGNALTAFSSYGKRSKVNAHVAFPMGETSCELNISPLRCSKENGIVFKPTVYPAWTSGTPILQLIPGSQDVEKLASSKIGTLLAVRTYSSTSLLEISTDKDVSHGALVDELAVITHADTGDKPVVDVLLPEAAPRSIFIVNNQGALYEGKLFRGEMTMRCVLAHRDEPNDRFFRLASGVDHNSCFMLTTTGALLVDLRVSDTAQTIHSRQHHNDFFTDLNFFSHDRLLRLCSTSEVLWIDQRYTKKPLFSVKHSRKFDRHLQVDSMLVDDRPLTFLTSRRNGLVTVYDVSQDEDYNLLHLHVPPYSLPTLQIPNSTLSGHVWFRHPKDSAKNTVSFMQLSDRLSLHRMDLASTRSINGGCDTVRYADGGHEWSDEVIQLEREMEDKGEYPGPMGQCRYEEVDLTDPYIELFCKDEPEKDSSAIYDILDSMPVFWQKMEEPVEHMLTTFDIAFCSGAEPRDPSRADFFTGTPLDSVRGYRAMKQGRIPMDPIKKKSVSHWNILPVLQCFVPDVRNNTEDLLARLSRYDLIADDDGPGTSYHRETEAKEQLALDLSLSSDVFSSHAIKIQTTIPDEDVDESMSRAAETMSIGITEPPPVSFGFLDPVAVEDGEEIQKFEKGEGGTMPLSLPLGARLLLSEWTIGSDPQEYTYVDPYDLMAQEVPSKAHIQQPSRKQVPTSVSRPTQIQRPPTIAVAAAAPAAPAIAITRPLAGPPAIASSRPPIVPPVAQSQQITSGIPGDSSQPMQMSQTQALFSSTQVLPGPYGGRPQPTKKKSAKKRFGGF